jgi:hypothetical protein
LLHHLESNFVLHAAAQLSFLGRFFAGLSASPVVEGSLIIFFVATYLVPSFDTTMPKSNQL